MTTNWQRLMFIFLEHATTSKLLALYSKRTHNRQAKLGSFHMAILAKLHFRDINFGVASDIFVCGRGSKTFFYRKYDYTLYPVDLRRVSKNVLVLLYICFGVMVGPPPPLSQPAVSASAFDCIVHTRYQ